TLHPTHALHAALPLPVVAPTNPTARIDAPTSALLNVDLTPSVKSTKVTAASILQQLEQRNPTVEVQPFSLSVWRPASGFLIVDRSGEHTSGLQSREKL